MGEIKVLSIGCTSNWPLSKLIRWFQRGMPWNRLPRSRKIPSHSAQVLFFTVFGCTHVYESTWYGYRPTTWKRWLKTHELIHAHECISTEHKKGIEWAFNAVGISYEYKSLFVFAWKIAKFVFGFKWVKHPYTTAYSMHCSEAATRFLQQDGIWTSSNPDSVSPLEFMHRLDSDNRFVDVTDRVIDKSWWR